MNVKTYEKHSMVYNDCSFMKEFLRSNEEEHKKELDKMEDHSGALAREYAR